MDFRHIVEAAAHVLRTSMGTYGGSAGMDLWRTVFATMRLQLDSHDATGAERARLTQMIGAAIDDEPTLAPHEKDALRAVLASAMDGQVRPYDATLGPRADFLNRIRY